MDSVIVFFANATYEEVEAAAKPFGFNNGTVCGENEHFYLWRYSETDQTAEMSVEAMHTIETQFGSAPKSAFQVASRHGAAACCALEVVSQLMQRFSPSVLDDDFDNLWSSFAVKALYESRPEKGIYALRDRPNIALHTEVHAPHGRR